MMRSLSSAVAGLRTHQTKMDVIGNNIANVNTYGFKVSRTTFADVYYQNLAVGSSAGTSRGGTNPTQIGYGSSVATIDVLNTQSGSGSTDRAMDVYITGDGYLVTQDANGNFLYTRMGAMYFDAEGNLVDSLGNYMMGFPTDADGQPIIAMDGTATSDELKPIQIDIALLDQLTGISISADGIISGILPGDRKITVSSSAPSWINAAGATIPEDSLYTGGVRLKVRAEFTDAAIQTLLAGWGSTGASVSDIEFSEELCLNKESLELSIDKNGSLYLSGSYINENGKKVNFVTTATQNDGSDGYTFKHNGKELVSMTITGLNPPDASLFVATAGVNPYQNPWNGNWAANSDTAAALKAALEAAGLTGVTIPSSTTDPYDGKVGTWDDTQNIAALIKALEDAGIQNVALSPDTIGVEYRTWTGTWTGTYSWLDRAFERAGLPDVRVRDTPEGLVLTGLSDLDMFSSISANENGEITISGSSQAGVFTVTGVAPANPGDPWSFKDDTDTELFELYFNTEPTFQTPIPTDGFNHSRFDSNFVFDSITADENGNIYVEGSCYQMPNIGLNAYPSYSFTATGIPLASGQCAFVDDVTGDTLFTLNFASAPTFPQTVTNGFTALTGDADDYVITDISALANGEITIKGTYDDGTGPVSFEAKKSYNRSATGPQTLTFTDGTSGASFSIEIDAATFPTVTTDEVSSKLTKAIDPAAIDYKYKATVKDKGGNTHTFPENGWDTITGDFSFGDILIPVNVSALGDVTGFNGTIATASTTDGEIINIGCLVLAKFRNASGLKEVGTTSFAVSPNSGEAMFVKPGLEGTGDLKAGYLEMSNVDISKEFTDMITTQRGFQANTRIVTVSDEMLNELVNLKR